ncbi:hypothetical protein [Rhizobium grahamii]|uniref:hypothetical protein n=1 Tax=Rhizobium grahamii TaxID=1120045 RepID=UPI00159ED984|nr:hypothetical protein [Rhizobium grahamii]
MKIDTAAYGVTDLSPQEAAEISGGIWQIPFAIITFVGFVAASIGGAALDHYFFD